MNGNDELDAGSARPQNGDLPSLRHLSIAFSKNTIIDDLSFEARRGETLAVIGPNGSGKAVLLKALLHLLPFRGEVKWAAGVRIGYVPQKVSADRQMPLLVRNLLEAKAHFMRLQMSAVDIACAQSGIHPALLESNIGEIFGGQFQKMLIALSFM